MGKAMWEIMIFWPGSEIWRDDDCIIKRGYRVRPSEEAALKLVRNCTNVNVPEVQDSLFPDVTAKGYDKNKAHNGLILMSYVEGTRLDEVWASCDDSAKRRVCASIWDAISEISKIPKPSGFSWQCSADGSMTLDPLLEEVVRSENEVLGELNVLKEDDWPTENLSDDHKVRRRVAQRYYHYNGRKHTREDIVDMLPRSEKSVFTHADIAPRNIFVDGAQRVTGIIDWENAGWYPEYWELANIMKPSSKDRDWQDYMLKSAPRQWDLSGVDVVRRILF